MDKLLVDSKSAAERLSMSRSFFYSMLSSGKIAPQPLSFGRKRLWRLKDLEDWVSKNCPTKEASDD